MAAGHRQAGRSGLVVPGSSLAPDPVVSGGNSSDATLRARSPTPPAAAHLQRCRALARAHEVVVCPLGPRCVVTEAVACGLPMLLPVLMQPWPPRLLPAPSRAGGKGTEGRRIRGIKCRRLLRHLVCVCGRPGCPRAQARGLSSDTPSGSCPHPAPAVAGPQWLLAWARRRDVTWGRSGTVPATCG